MASNSDDKLDSARRLYGDGDVQAARKIVEDVLRVEPANVGALLLAAEWYRPDNPAVAFKVYARVAQLAPQRPEAPAGLALLYHEQGDVARCDQCLDASLDLDPEYLRRRHYAGMVEAAGAALLHAEGAPDPMLGFYDSVVAAYQRAVGRYAISPLVSFNLARVLLVLGEPELAEKACARCLELDPDMTEAYAGMVEVAFALEKYDQAVEWAAMLEGRSWPVTGDANDPHWMTSRAAGGDLSLGFVYLVQAKAHLWLGQFDCVVQAIRRAVEMEPWNSAAWYTDLLDEHIRLGKALLENSQLSDAVRVLGAGRDVAVRMNYHKLFLWLAEAYLAQALAYREAADRAQADAWLARVNELIAQPPVPVPAEASPAWTDLKARLPEDPHRLFGFLRR
jgi:tetratricopeptide (TPR) repeat protein